jgi:ribose transport system substrate-binding protein
MAGIDAAAFSPGVDSNCIADSSAIRAGLSKLFSRGASPMPRLSRLFCGALATFSLLAVIGCSGTGGGNEPGGSASNSGGKKRIVFVTNGDDPFWDACLSGLKEGEKQFDLAAAGLVVERDVNNGTDEGQIEKLRQYATQGDIAGVAISVIKADNLAIVDEMRKLQKKGIKVITVDSDVNRQQYRDARSFYIGTDNIVGGRALGQAAKTLLESRGTTSGGYAQFAGFVDVDNARNRMDGVQEALGSAFTEKTRDSDGMDTAKARDNVRSALQNHQDLVALIGIWAYNAPAITDVLTESGNRDKFVVATFDAQDLAISAMSEGKIDVMVVQNPFDMGVQTCRLMKAMITDDQGVIDEMFPNKDQPDGDIYTTGLRVVVPNADSPVKAEQFDADVVEFMLLPDFQAWLKKYNLTSS